ncbi:MAG: adenine deaminase C-terminal domain-containing protein [Actinomycetota bacterium]
MSPADDRTPLRGDLERGRAVLAPQDLAIVPPAREPTRVRVMELTGVGRTRAVEEMLSPGTWGSLAPDPTRDIAKVAVIDRGGAVGAAFVRGFGLQAGAMAAAVDRDAGRAVVVGTSDRECAVAVNALGEQGGGYVVTVGARPVATVPPSDAADGSSDASLTLAGRLRSAGDTLRELGCGIPAPFLRLALLSASSLPELAITELGLLDVKTRRTIDVVV